MTVESSKIVIFGLICVLLRTAPCLGASVLFQELKLKINGPSEVKEPTEISGAFEQIKTFHELGIQISSEGTFSIRKDPKGKNILIWNVLKPEISKLCIDQDTLVLEGGKKQIIKLKEVAAGTYDQILYLLSVMSMNMEFLETNFSLQKESEDYFFTPLVGKKFLFEKISIRLGIKGLIQNVQLREKSKDQVEVRFSNVAVKNSKLGNICL